MPIDEEITAEIITRREKELAAKARAKSNGHGDDIPPNFGEEHPADNNTQAFWHVLGDTPPVAPPWLFDSLIPEVGTGIAAGQSGFGKTFVGDDLATSIITGSPFVGLSPSKIGGIVWLAAEGRGDIEYRTEAALEAKLGRKIEPGEHFPFLVQRTDISIPKLTDKDALQQFIARTEQARKILDERFAVPLVAAVFDTMSAAAGFSDGSPAECQGVMDMLNALATRCEIFILVIDHYGKDVERGIMGSHLKTAGADVILAVLGKKSLEGETNDRRMAVTKVRNGKVGAVYPFTLVGAREGTTCTVRWEVEAMQKMEAATKWPESLNTFKRSVGVALVSAGRDIQPYEGDSLRVRAVPAKYVRAEFMASYVADSDGDENAKYEAKKKAWIRQLRTACDKGFVVSRETDGEDWLWLAKA